ncbi:MAG: AAA family ATPase [Candidatus Geothermincolia bacterium]
MKRIAESELVSWKDRPGRKPLIVRGARQVGKTYLVESFGKSYFQSILTVNLGARVEDQRSSAGHSSSASGSMGFWRGWPTALFSLHGC